MRRLFISVLWLPLVAFSQDKAETRELVGHVGSRSALLVLNAVPASDAGWRLSGEYFLLPTLARRFVQGERGPELGVTTLREGTTPILYGRDPIGELRGIWRDGTFKGTRYGPGGQERERFEFSEEFPSMQGYSAAVRCDGLAYEAEHGKVKSFEWRSRGCDISGLEQQPMKGGLRLEAQACSVTLREVGEAVRVAAQGCGSQCSAGGDPEPLIVERRGGCRPLRAEAR